MPDYRVSLMDDPLSLRSAWEGTLHPRHGRPIDAKDTDDYEDVTNPEHYRDHPSGVECIEITQHMNFCLGNAIKYIWRAGKKDDAVKDLEKAIWYLKREIKRLTGDYKVHGG